MKETEFTHRILPLRDRMFRYAQSLLLSADEAEDAVHDLLERLWRDREELPVCRNAASFVMTALRNRCYDRLRQRKACRQRADSLAGRTERLTTSAADGWEARDLVRRAMAALPERQREAIALKDLEGYPTREIAELLSTDEAQVRVILSRARQGLREALKRLTDDGREQN